MFIQSVLVAIFIALLLPVAWVTFLSEVRTSPVISEAVRDSMSPAEHDVWFEQNAKPASLLHHIKTIPGFIYNNWVGFVQASAAIFIIVFLMNYFVLIFLHAKP